VSSSETGHWLRGFSRGEAAKTWYPITPAFLLLRCANIKNWWSFQENIMIEEKKLIATDVINFDICCKL
jgi:hypothetical protein